jgi:hypothetical protein
VSQEHLATYLNDHLAGANAALEILDHLVTESPDQAVPLTALKSDIAEDHRQLRILMAGLNILESRIRIAGSWIAETLAEAKLGVDDDPTGPLRRLERLEALAIGIEGKIALWRALDAVASSNSELGKLDYERLIRRGQEQRARVEMLRLDAARSAL